MENISSFTSRLLGIAFTMSTSWFVATKFQKINRIGMCNKKYIFEFRGGNAEKNQKKDLILIRRMRMKEEE